MQPNLYKNWSHCSKCKSFTPSPIWNNFHFRFVNCINVFIRAEICSWNSIKCIKGIAYFFPLSMSITKLLWHLSAPNSRQTIKLCLIQFLFFRYFFSIQKDNTSKNNNIPHIFILFLSILLFHFGFGCLVRFHVARISFQHFNIQLFVVVFRCCFYFFPDVIFWNCNLILWADWQWLNTEHWKLNTATTTSTFSFSYKNYALDVCVLYVLDDGAFKILKWYWIYKH